MEQKKKIDNDYLYGMKSFFKICPICKREKYVINRADYVYKIGTKYYCSWTCYRKAQKLLEEKRTKKKANLIYGN